MTNVQTLKQTHEMFARTQQQAEETVKNFKEKHGANVVNEQIIRKVKSTKEYEIEYFVVKITVQYVTVKELLEELV